MKFISEYLKKVFSKWWLTLGFIPEILDKISFYFGKEISLPNELTYISVLFLIFLSTYLVWKDEKTKIIELEDKLKNPVDYEIIAKIHPLDEEPDIHLENVKKNIEETKKELKNEIIPEIEKLQQVSKSTSTMEISNNLKQIQKMLDSHNQLLKSISGNDTDTRSYEERLKSYKYDLEDYIDEMEDYIQTLESFYKNRKNEIFYVNFIIHNTGRIFDKGLDVEIFSKNSIFSEFYLRNEFPKRPIKPNKPKKKISLEPTYAKAIASISNHPLDITKNHPHNLRTFIEIEEKSISLRFRDLKAANTKSLLENGIYIKSEDLNDLKFEISSEKSNGKINKKVKIEKLDKITLDEIHKELFDK